MLPTLSEGGSGFDCRALFGGVAPIFTQYRNIYLMPCCVQRCPVTCPLGEFHGTHQRSMSMAKLG